MREVPVAPPVELAVDGRVLRARRAAALWIDPIYSLVFIFAAAQSARHIFELGGDVVDVLLSAGVFVLAIVAGATHRRLRAWVGDPRPRFVRQEGAWKLQLAMVGALAVSFPIALHAWRDAVHPEGIVTGAFGLVMPLMVCVVLWPLGGAWRAAAGAYVALLVRLLVWPPPPEKRFWVGIFVPAALMALTILLSDLMFLYEVRAARRAAEADGDTV